MGATIPGTWGSRLIKTGRKGHCPILKSYERTQHTLQRANALTYAAPLPCGASESCTFQFNATVLFYFLLFSLHSSACGSWWFCLFTAVKLETATFLHPLGFLLTIPSIYASSLTSMSFPFSSLILPLLASQL